MNNTLEAEILASREAKATSRYLKTLTFQIVRRALREHFGENYSDCCLQSSVAIQEVLSEFGIKANLVKGGVCLPWVSKGQKFAGGWHGFWDAHHHFWIVTEFGEYVDLTISKINYHRASPHQDGVDPYPIWTSDQTFLSNVFLYLPEAPKHVNLFGDDAKDLDKFLADVHTYRKSFSPTTSIQIQDAGHADTILEGMQTCYELSQMRDEWAGKTRIVLENPDPLPVWVENRIEALRKAHERPSGTNQT